ncbi:MAG: hypothetical protein ACKVT1_16345, partial [Dehalococcoidia bacterium]
MKTAQSRIQRRRGFAALAAALLFAVALVAGGQTAADVEAQAAPRTVRVVEVTGTAVHPAATFGGVVTIAAAPSFSLDLAANALDNAPGAS